MKRIIILLVAAFTLAACAAQRMPYNSKDPAEVNSKSRIRTGANEVTGYTNIYDYLRGKVPGLIDVKVNIDGRLDSSNADVMLDSTLESEQALKAYATHPEHVAVANGKVRPYTIQRSCLDFEV